MIRGRHARRFPASKTSKMSKSEEFDALANAATPGDWECRDGEDIVAEVDHEDTLTIECVSSFAYKQDARGMTVRVNPMDYDGDDDDTAEGWAKSDREFIMWCANNRAIMLRSLRIKEMIEFTLAQEKTPEYMRATLESLMETGK